MVLLSLGTVAAIAACASPACRLGRALGCAPLRWLGVRSYCIYLWHYPIIVLTTPAGGGENLARGCAQLAASIGAAALSWRFIEEPVRSGALGRLWTRLRAGGWRAIGRTGGAAAGATATALVLAGCGLAGMVPAASKGTPIISPAMMTAPPAASASSISTGRSAGPGGAAPPGPAPDHTQAWPRDRGRSRRAARWCTSETRLPTAWSFPPTSPTPR
jgi:hypothetical protein